MGFLEELRRCLRNPDQFKYCDEVATYAEEIRAIDYVGGEPVPTRIGQIFLGLRGRDAVRWLLHVEAAQSVSTSDNWRIHPDLAALLLEQFSVSAQAYSKTLSRMCEFALVYCRGDDRFSREPSAEPLLEEIAQGADTPFKLLAHAVLQDEQNRVLSLAQAAQASAAESIARQARLVAHELHNALGPVRVALDNLYEVMGKPGAQADVENLRSIIDTGLARATGFLKDTLGPMAVLVEPPEPFDVGATLRDAIAEVAGEVKGQIHLVPAPLLPPITGFRHRFVLALRDLFRNSAQAVRDRPADIRVEAKIAGENVIVTVDDNGPGVPKEYRQAVFAAGFTLRPGGSGQGLALLKGVVETDLRGTVSCEDSPLGGARFVVTLPFLLRGNE